MGRGGVWFERVTKGAEKINIFENLIPHVLPQTPLYNGRKRSRLEPRSASYGLWDLERVTSPRRASVSLGETEVLIIRISPCFSEITLRVQTRRVVLTAENTEHIVGALTAL